MSLYQAFDGVKSIGRQVEQLSLTVLEALAYSMDFVRTEIVHHHGVAGLQNRAQNLTQKGEEYLPDRSPLSATGKKTTIGEMSLSNVSARSRREG